MSAIVLDDILEALKNMLASESSRCDFLFNHEDVCLLLQDATDTTCSSSTQHVSVASIGYPLQPYVKRISAIVYSWMLSGRCDVDEFHKFSLLNEENYPEARRERVTSLRADVVGAISLWQHWNAAEKEYFLRQLFVKLGRRGVLDMLNLRQTFATHLQIPPPMHNLLHAFNTKHGERSDLTVGARALAKHFHRDQTDSWWGKSTGTEAEKNEHALHLVRKILDGAAWINIHELPGQLPVLEVRMIEGYGARWSADASVFRGFLEPQMEKGWEVGYRH